jgi:SanA protein
MKYLMRRIVGLFILFVLAVVWVNAYVILWSWDAVVSPEYTEHTVGVILWASVRSDGSLSPILQQRVDGAIRAYTSGVIDRIIVSGYDKDAQYLEAMSMSDYLLDQGIADDDILVDSGGYDTLASMQRVHKLLEQQEKKTTNIVIFTQRYHLWRAIMLAREVWLDPMWYAVDPRALTWRDMGTSREILARIKGVFEVMMGV